MSVVTSPPRATIEDQARVTSRAELINGKVVHYVPTGHRPGIVSGRVFRRLADFVDTIGRGVAYPDDVGFTVPELSSGRESFSPDTAYYTGPLPTNLMKFVTGAPDLAVEVGSEGDYGPAAETAMAAKRADYFEAGTKVVWDVDPVANVAAATGSATPTRWSSAREPRRTRSRPSRAGGCRSIGS